MLYRHYKGNTYRVLGIAKHSETLEPLVIYQDVCDESKIWARPQAMFEDEVEVDGKKQKRFAEVGENSAEAQDYCHTPKTVANVFDKLNKMGK